MPRSARSATAPIPWRRRRRDSKSSSPSEQPPGSGSPSRAWEGSCLSSPYGRLPDGSSLKPAEEQGMPVFSASHSQGRLCPSVPIFPPVRRESNPDSHPSGDRIVFKKQLKRPAVSLAVGGHPHPHRDVPSPGDQILQQMHDQSEHACGERQSPHAVQSSEPRQVPH